MNNNYQTLNVSLENNIVTIALHRPEAANSLCAQMGDELLKVALFCDANPAVKAVILTAKGNFFCPGADLPETLALGDDMANGIKQLANQLHNAIATFARMQAPMISAINGTAAGAGLSMAVFADYVIASEQAKFTAAYGNAGLTPDGSLSYYLPRLIGLRRAQDLLFTNRVLTAQQAFDMGLVTEVVDNEKLAERALAIARKIASGSLYANAQLKQLLLNSDTASLETQMELEGRTIASSIRVGEGREGITAFVEKRQPNFKN